MFQRHLIQNQGLMLITTNTNQKKQIFADQACARQAVESLYQVQTRYPFFLYAFVIMPDHCHFLLNVPENGSISRIMYAYKRSVSFTIGRPIWQSRFHLKMIDGDPDNVFSYIDYNPVKAGLCTQPDQYPWSSASGRWDVATMGFF